MKHILGTPFYTLRISIAQVTNVHFFRDWVQEYCRILAGCNAKAAAIAPLLVHPHHPDLLVPGEGIPFAGRKTLLALDAEERCIDSFLLPDQHFDSGSPWIELLFMRKGANLFANTAPAALLVVHIDFWTDSTGFHFQTSISDLLFGSCRRFLTKRYLPHPLSLDSVRPIFFSRLLSFLHHLQWFSLDPPGLVSPLHSNTTPADLPPQIRLLHSLVVQQFVVLGTQYNSARLHDITTICQM